MAVARVLSLSTAMLMATFAGASAQEPGAAQRPGGPNPEINRVETETATAKVVAVDRDKRTVTLQEEGGSPVTFVAGPEIRNFDQIAPGDQVKTEFVRATVVSLRKPGEPSGAAGSTTVERAPAGEKPGALLTTQAELTATVEDIDYAKREAVLRGPAGNLQTVKVDPRVQNLESFKKGDEIVIRRTEALLINVTK